MKLKRLIIQGFKSFKDRTIIHFDDGITGIVGPNGCGKSNIVDALFWVMGEQSAKHLRGNSMKDVIFAGSSKYSPGAWAEASLVLENTTGKHIHIGQQVCNPSEIQLTRKLYRNGESEYRINGEPARLKDIHEVFMDTGAGAKSYSIIAQGEINKLVQAKPEERRTMIEEVAGITKFKARKKESLRKIDQTQSNLARLNDLQSEIEKNLRALQKQAEKAERARSLKDKIRRNELVFNSHKVMEYMKDFKEGAKKNEDLTLELETWEITKNDLELSLAEERILKEELTDKLDIQQSEFNDLSKALATAEERYRNLENSCTEKHELIETRKQELEDIAHEVLERIEKKDGLISSKEDLLASEEVLKDFSDLEEEVEQLKEELADKTESLKDQQDSLSIRREELQALEQEIFRNNSRLEEYSASLQDMTQEIEALETQYSGFSGTIAKEREEIQTLEAKVEELSAVEESSKERLADVKENVKELEISTREKQSELIRTDSKLASLHEIKASLEGAHEGATEFLKSDQSNGFELLGNLIKCKDEHTAGVQALIQDLSQVIIGGAADNASLMDWMKENDQGGLEYIALSGNTRISAETKERLELNDLVGVHSLGDIVEIEGQQANALKVLFQGMFLVENFDLEKADKISSDIQFKAIASLDGKIVCKNLEGGKTITRKSNIDQQQGAIARNNMIAELEEKVVTLKEEVTQLEQELVTAQDLLIELQSSYEQVREEHAQVRADLAGKKSALESKLEGFESGNTRLEILKSRKSEISKSRLDLLENEDSFGKKQEELKTLLEDTSSIEEEAREQVEILTASFEEKREELMQKQVDAKSFEERINAYTHQIEDIETQIAKLQEKEESHKNLIERYDEEISSIQENIQTLQEENKDSASTLLDREEILSVMKDELAQLLTQMQEREEEVKRLTSSINKAEKEIAQTEVKLTKAIDDEAHITRDIFEKYQVDLRKAVGEFLEYSEEDYAKLSDISDMYLMETEEGPQMIEAAAYEFYRRYGQDLKDCEVKFRQYKGEFNRLGEINWQAVEDYERQKLRAEFLKQQEEELKKSLEDLQTAIDHIDHKSKERFKIAYNEVNTRFEKVFPIIFGGGNARLELKGDINDIDCGVDIIAQPPGKKMQNINLMSGGEKALTAVSLIFSIFLVKPSPFCLLDEVDAPLDDANVGRFNELLKEMSRESQFILITHNKKTMELNDTLYGVTMQEPGISKAVSVQLQ